MPCEKVTRKKLKTSTKILLALFFLTFALTLVANCYSYYHAGNRLNDLVLDHVPIQNVGWAYDLFSLASMGIVLWYLYKNPQKLNQFLICYIIIMNLRSICIVLTPLGVSGTDFGLIGGFLGSLVMGQFFSGHTAHAFLAYLLTDGWTQILQMICTIAIVLFLILSHGHYSIDIIGGLVFAYAVYAFSERNLKWVDEV